MRVNNNFKLSLSALAVGLAITPVTFAQDNNPAYDEKDDLERIVVIGNVHKPLIEAAVPFTQITEEDILRKAPRNVADTLTEIPSMQVDSSAGNTDNQYRYRGIGAGGTQFLEFEEDGIPILRDAPDFLYRVHNGIGSVDAVRGGNSPILRTAAVGAVINFQNKAPNFEEYEGDVFVQTSDFGMERLEFWNAGPITDNLAYSVSGYTTKDDGVKDVEYGANEGYNLYGALQYEFEDGSGYFKVSGRKFDENNVVYLGSPVTGDIDNPDTIVGGPGIDESLIGEEIAHNTTNCAPDTPCDLDTTDGNSSEMTYIGTELNKEWDLDNGTIVNFISRNRYTDIDSKYAGYYAAGWAVGGDNFYTGDDLVEGLFNGNTMADFTHGLPAGFTPTGYNLQNQQGDVLDHGTCGPTGCASQSEELANGNGLFAPIASFDQSNPAHVFQQDLELNLEFDTDEMSHLVSFGYYYLDMVRRQTNRQQIFLTDMQENASLVDVYLTDDMGNEVALTENGFISENHWIGNYKWEDKINAFYANYEVKWDTLTVDAGIRHDQFKHKTWQEGTQQYYGDGEGQQPLPEAGGSVLPSETVIEEFTGIWTQTEDWETNEISWTVGANYVFDQFKDDFAIYGRYTEGSLPAPGGATSTEVMEFGARFDNGDFGIAANVFKMTQDGDIQERGLVIETEDGTKEDVVARYQTDKESVGLEVEARYNVTDQLKFTLVGTIQDPEFKSGGSAEVAPGSDVTQEELDRAVGDLTKVDGNQITNQADYMGTFSVEYEMELANYGYLLFTSSARFVSEVPLDDANSIYAPSYTTYNLGANFESREGDWYGRIHVQNLTDEDTIVSIHGDPTSITNANISETGYYAKTLQGRNIVFGVGYRF